MPRARWLTTLPRHCQNGPCIIVALRKWAEENKSTIAAFHASIDEAEQFIRNNQEEALEIEKTFLLGASTPDFPPALSSIITVKDFEFFNEVGK